MLAAPSKAMYMQRLLYMAKRLATVMLFFVMSDSLSWVLKRFGVNLTGSLASLIAMTLLLFCSPTPFLAELLRPGASMLLRWYLPLNLPVLIMLPISLKAIPAMDILKLVAMQVFGVMFIAGISGWPLIALHHLHRRLWPERVPVQAEPQRHRDDISADVADAPPSTSLLLPIPALVIAAVATILFSALYVWVSVVRVPAFFLLAMLSLPATFGFGQYLRGRFPSSWLIPHAFLISTGITIALFYLLSLITDVASDDVFNGYHTEGEINMFSGVVGPIGPGNVLLYVLNAAVVAMALPMFDQKAVMLRYGIEIFLVGIFVAMTSMLSATGAARLLQMTALSGRSVALRSVSLPIAVTHIVYLNGDPGIASVSVIVSGIVGTLAWRHLLCLFRYRDHVPRGYTMGAISGGLGTAICLVNEPESAPATVVATLTIAIMSSICVALPSFRHLLTWILSV